MQKLGLLIGRFSPIHAGHRDLIRKASAQSDQLFILIGSANSARTIKTPFTYKERKEEVIKFLSHECIKNVSIYPINDVKYNDTAWISSITHIVDSHKEDDTKVTLFGHHKDDTQYLKWFPQYKLKCFDTVYSVSSTEIREQWFKRNPHVFEQSVVDDWNYFENEKKLFSNYPFPDTLSFNCGDSILECAGHILLIQRGRSPGKGTWALPGGFKNRDETFVDCALRELIEETNIKVPEKVLRGSIVNTKLFDSPARGCGIPRVTQCVHIKVNPNPDGTLPKANGGDDASTANWFPIYDIMNNIELYDDHLSIISSMCGVVPMPAHSNTKFL